MLEKVRGETGLPVLTDVHSAGQVSMVADVVDVLQTPAFLARQTDLIEAAAASGKPVNFKKAQFMAPADVKPLIGKARDASKNEGHGEGAFMLCERGTSFGYNNLVVDMRSLVLMREAGCPVVFDATHSVQLPGGMGTNPAGSASSSTPWRGRRSRSEWRGCSWNAILTRTRRYRTDRTPCHSPRWKR